MRQFCVSFSPVRKELLTIELCAADKSKLQQQHNNLEDILRRTAASVDGKI